MKMTKETIKEYLEKTYENSLNRYGKLTIVATENTILYKEFDIDEVVERVFEYQEENGGSEVWGKGDEEDAIQETLNEEYADESGDWEYGKHSGSDNGIHIE